jgi:sigma-B regulation protein RsbU (phosphoserine phosphatase)
MDPVQAKAHTDIPAEVLPALVEIGEEINASLDLDEVLQKSAALVKRLIDYEIFAVMLLDERTQELYFRFAIGHRPEVVQHWRVPLGKGITGIAAATRQPFRVGDVSAEPRYINALDSVRSELAVPLLYKNQCIGVLDIQSNQADYFTRDQQSILTLLASRIAIAVENARLYERTRRQAETLLLLNEIGREASSILDVEELIRRTAGLVHRIINYQMFSLFFYDEHINAFRQRIHIKYGQSVQEEVEIPLSKGIIGAAAATRQPVLVPDVTADPRYIPINSETRSELALPLIHKDRVIAVLDLESTELNYFNEEHVRTLSVLAAQLAVAMENARLYEQLSADESRMERELQAARRIQGAMLPEVPTEDYGLELAARYVSARELGGDLYDFIRYSPSHLGIGLGDVSGKGTAAALYGAVAIGILRSLAQKKIRPAETLRELNDLLCERRIEGRFMTLCFARWHRARRKLRLASAGHSQPLLYQSGQCEKIPITGFPLGFEPGVEYEELTLTLSPGDVLLFYSDGIPEAASRSGEQFGTSRVMEILQANAAKSASDLADELMSQVAHFATGAEISDDRTLLVIKVK